MTLPRTRIDDRTLLDEHHPIGVSTGLASLREGSWEAKVEAARAFSPFAVELSALAEPELPSLIEYLASEPPLPFTYVSVHGPSKSRQLAEPELVARLMELVPLVDAIVMHPDTMDSPEAYLPLGRTLVVENMDARKEEGRTGAELTSIFEALPEAGFCFDIAHAWSIDPEMGEAHALLDAYGARLRHLHVSSMSEGLKHIPLRPKDRLLFQPVLRRCVDVPWIFEAVAGGG